MSATLDRCPKCTAFLTPGKPCGCIDEQVELVAIKLYRYYAEDSRKPWTELDERIRAAWRVEAEDVLS